MESSIPEQNIRNSAHEYKKKYERSERRSPSDIFKSQQNKTKNKKVLVPIRHFEKRRHAETSVLGTKRDI